MAASPTAMTASRRQARKIGREHFQPFGRAVERGHVGAGNGELGGLAAGGGAKVEDALAGRTLRGDGRARPQRRPEPTRRPPHSLQARGSGRASRGARDPVGSTRPPSFSAQSGAIGLDGQVERRFVAMARRRCDGRGLRRRSVASGRRASVGCRLRAGRTGSRNSSRRRTRLRKTPLTRLAKGALLGSSRVARTARSTAAWSGDVEKQDLGAAAIRIHSSCPQLRGRPFSTNWLRARRIVPSRRKRDGGDGAGKAAIALIEADDAETERLRRQNFSSSAWPPCTTSQMIAAAATRAARPGWARALSGASSRPWGFADLSCRAALPDAAERLAEILVHSPRDQVGVACRQRFDYESACPIFLP